MKNVLFLMMVLSFVLSGCDLSEEALFGEKGAKGYYDGSTSNLACSNFATWTQRDAYNSACSVPDEMAIRTVSVKDGKLSFDIAQLDDLRFPKLTLRYKPLYWADRQAALSFDCVAAAGEANGIRTVICSPVGDVVVRDVETSVSDIRFRVAEVRLDNLDSGCDSSVRYQNDSTLLDGDDMCGDESHVTLNHLVFADLYLEGVKH